MARGPLRLVEHLPVFGLDFAAVQRCRGFERVASASFAMGNNVRPCLAPMDGQDFVAERQLVMDRCDFRVRRPAGKLGGVGCTLCVINPIISFEHGPFP